MIAFFEKVVMIKIRKQDDLKRLEREKRRLERVNECNNTGCVHSAVSPYVDTDRPGDSWLKRQLKEKDKG